MTEVVLSVLDKAGQLDASARGAKGEQFFFDLLRTLLNLVALGDKGVRAQALEGIESLAEMLELDSPQDLYRRHFDEVSCVFLLARAPLLKARGLGGFCSCMFFFTPHVGVINAVTSNRY